MTTILQPQPPQPLPSHQQSDTDEKYELTQFNQQIGAKDEQKQQMHQQMMQQQQQPGEMSAPSDNHASAPSSSSSSTLPNFDSFETTFVPTAHTYRTPFDSPDPIQFEGQPGAAAPMQQMETIQEKDASALVGGQVEGDAPSTQSARHIKSHSIGHTGPAFAFDDPFSIFHAVPLQQQTKSTPKHEKESAKSRSAAPSPVRKAASLRTPKHLSVNPQQSKSPSPSPRQHSARNSKPANSLTVDPVEEAVIPDILSSTAMLNRRASEPTLLLGSRRMALAAASRAADEATQNAEKAEKVPTPELLPPGPRLTIDTDVLSVPAASSVNLSGPFKNVAAGPVTPKRACRKCENQIFASGLCATHLTESGDDEPSTPTTTIRRIVGMWRRDVLPSHNSKVLNLKWTFWKKGEQYVVQLMEDSWTLERTVIVNNRTTYRGEADPEDEFKLSMLLGSSKSNAFEVILGAVPRVMRGTPEIVSGWNYESDWIFELWIDGFPFSEAQNNWMSELGVAQKMQAEVRLDADPSAASSSSSSSASVDPVTATFSPGHQQHWENLNYIKSHWHRTQTTTKTSMGFDKNTVIWRFTLQGKEHQLMLVHSETSGKRRIEVDGRPVLTKKPSFFNGLLLKRSASHHIDLSHAKIEVRIQKMDYLEDNAFHGPIWEQTHPNFIYELFIDRVPFSKCTKTIAEYAGGMYDVEEALRKKQEKEGKKKRREQELKRDPRVAEVSPQSD